MKLSKIVLLSFAAFVLGISITFAQGNEPKLTEKQQEQMAESLEAYYAVLDLSEEQKTEFEAISKKYGAQMMEVRDGSGGKMQKYKQVKAIRKEKDAEMKALLSDDQYKVYLEKQEELQDKMREQRSQR